MSTEKVAEFIIQTNYAGLPADIAATSKTAVLDHVGVMLGARGDKSVAAVSKLARALGGRGDATLLDCGDKVPAATAAMVGAVMAGTMDLDDGAFRPEGHLTHAGRVIIPSALAVAEYCNASGKELIEAVAIGYEVSLRAGWLIRNWGEELTPAGMVANFGAAAATGKLLGLNRAQIISALGIAEAHCLHPSKAIFIHSHAMTKDSCGWGAMTGITAALLAEAGFEGPASLFDLPEYNQEPLATLGDDWETRRLYFKPYPSCRNNHAAVGGIIDLMAQHQLTPESIRSIAVGVAKWPAGTTAYYRPKNTWDAQFSIPFVVGVASIDGELGPAQIAEARLNEPAVLAQADKVTVVIDPEAEAAWPGSLPGRVRLETVDGREFESYVAHPKGDPENPLSEAELNSKFRMLVAPMLGADSTESLIRLLTKLEDEPDFTGLQRLLTHRV
jgi:2-methylcitrate dehydratase PrpD